ncbi:MAG: hypothetical protein AAGI03_01855 [Pseudomonadota bacterium]
MGDRLMKNARVGGVRIPEGQNFDLGMLFRGIPNTKTEVTVAAPAELPKARGQAVPAQLDPAMLQKMAAPTRAQDTSAALAKLSQMIQVR